MNTTQEHKDWPALLNHLHQTGWESSRLWYQLKYTKGTYMIAILETDSYEYIVYSITNTRFDSGVYRGRYVNNEIFDTVFTTVKEDYDLSTEEKESLHSKR